jgi:outer membrane protein assembly factor BamB
MSRPCALRGTSVLAAILSCGTGGSVFSGAAVSDGRMYVGSKDGYLYAFGLP